MAIELLQCPSGQPDAGRSAGNLDHATDVAEVRAPGAGGLSIAFAVLLFKWIEAEAFNHAAPVLACLWRRNRQRGLTNPQCRQRARPICSGRSPPRAIRARPRSGDRKSVV